MFFSVMYDSSKRLNGFNRHVSLFFIMRVILAVLHFRKLQTVNSGQPIVDLKAFSFYIISVLSFVLRKLTVMLNNYSIVGLHKLNLLLY